jgi:hypothetical protein
MTQIKVVEIKKSAIDRFCDSWPCHGFPDNLDFIIAAFDGGDLVDYELEDENKEIIEDRSFDGSGAMSALLDDAQKFSVEASHNEESGYRIWPNHYTRILPQIYDTQGTIGPRFLYL